MKAVTVILGFLAGLSLFTPTQPVSAQTGYAPQVAKLASLRSGSPQQIVNTLETIKHDDLARTLYLNLYTVAGSEPTSLIEASSIAKAIGFVLVMGLDDEMNELSETEFSEKLTRLSSLLLQITPEVGSSVEQYQWRAVELMQFCTAYDFYRAITGTSHPYMEDLLAAYAAAATAQLNNPFVIKNNLSLKLAAAAGYAGLMLDGRKTQNASKNPDTWIAAALQHIETTIWEYQSNPDGLYGYSEGPWYFRYAMMNLLPFFIAFDVHTDGGPMTVDGIEYQSPLRDPRYHRLFDWIASLRMPDGMLPPFEDTYMNSFFPELGIVGSVLPQYGYLAWQNFTAANEPVGAARISSELARTFDGRVEYLLGQPSAAPATCTQPLIRFMPDAGYAVFRSDWTERALYFAMIGKHGIARTHRSPVGSGHKHANEGAFLLHAGGELLLLEPGYYSSQEREALVYGDHHNIILVDGKGPDSTSYGSNLFGVDAYIGDTLSRGSNGLTSIRTRYQDTDIERRAAIFGGRVVILRDAATSASAHCFTQQLHGNGNGDEGTYTMDPSEQLATWTSGAMTLHAVVQSPSSTLRFSTERRRHAPSSRRFAEHDALYSSVTGSTALYHTVLYPSAAGSAFQSSTSRPTETSSLISIRTGNDQLVSLVKSNQSSISVTAPQLGVLTTDALAFHCILDPAGRPESWMCDEGSSLVLEDQVLLSSSMPVRAVWESLPHELRLTLRAQERGTVRLRMPSVVNAVEGNGLGSWSMEGSMLRLELVNGNADLDIALSGVATSVAMPEAAVTGPVLHAPYPHPLRADRPQSLRVPYNIRSGSRVQFTLYDALGRKIISRDAGHQGGGAHELLIPIRALPAGSYLLRLQSTQGSAYRTMIVR